VSFVKEDFAKARKIMVDNQIRPVGVTNYALLDSLGKIPREKFVPENRVSLSYCDSDHKLSESGRYLMSPASFARLAQLADVKQNEIILLVGCGTGYSVAVLSGLCSAVFGIEDDEELVKKAESVLADLNIGNSAVLTKDLSKGVPSEAPFDLILIEGEVDSVPSALLSQLRDGGRLVAVIKDGAIGKASVFVKSGKDVSQRIGFDVKIPSLSLGQDRAQFAL